jgi:hypothetical protein
MLLSRISFWLSLLWFVWDLSFVSSRTAFAVGLSLMMVIGDTLTYTLGAMKPETANADVITADAVAKQEALNKVSDEYWQWLWESWRWFCADLLCAARYRLRK